MRWAHLLFLHWELPAEELRGLLPPGLELDTFEGRAFVGLVPFTMTGVRPRLCPPVPGLSAFHEVNVRTYVHYAGHDPGVWFFSLDAANRLAVRLARWSFRLPYHHARMSLIAEGWAAGDPDADESRDGPAPIIHYTSDRLWPGPMPAACTLSYRPAGEVAAATSGTLEHFLVERYILYAYAKGVLYRGRIHHRPYPLQPAAVPVLRENLVAAAGLARPTAQPLAHYAREVRVEVFPLRRVAT